MQGKPLNAWKGTPTKVKAFPLFRNLAQELGIDPDTLPTDATCVATCPVRRIIFVFDPDADGIHCSALMLWFFYRWMPDLLASGYLFMASPPICELTAEPSGQRSYPSSEQEAASIIAQWNSSSENNSSSEQHVRRHTYRGLASLGSELLARCCVDPATRRIHRLRRVDAESSLQVFGFAK